MKPENPHDRIFDPPIVLHGSVGERIYFSKIFDIKEVCHSKSKVLPGCKTHVTGEYIDSGQPFHLAEKSVIEYPYEIQSKILHHIKNHPSSVNLHHGASNTEGQTWEPGCNTVKSELPAIIIDEATEIPESLWDKIRLRLGKWYAHLRI